MSLAVPEKILLKSCTKMSLHDRFSVIKNMPVENPPVQQVRVTGLGEGSQAASAKNRKLAQQMAARASRGSGTSAAILSPRGRAKTLKQRLGVKARLTLRGGNVTSVGALRGRIGSGATRGMVRTRGTFTVTNTSAQVWRGQRGRGRGQTFTTRGVLRGTRGFSRARGRRGQLGSAQQLHGIIRGGVSKRSRAASVQRGMRYQARGQRGFNRGRGGASAGGRGGRGGRGSIRGGRGGARGGRGGRGRLTVHKTYTQEELDNDLDVYMSGTRSHLDDEIDKYMAAGQ